MTNKLDPKLLSGKVATFLFRAQCQRPTCAGWIVEGHCEFCGWTPPEIVMHKDLPEELL